MATNEDFEKTPLSNEPFSHLLDDSLAFGTFVYPSSSMLCFEKYRGNGGGGGGVAVGSVGGVVGGSESLSASSSNNSSSSTNISKSKRNRGGEVNTGQTCSVESKKMNKKTKTTNPTMTKTVKVRKEKLGERITALQQLVSPFGKTDTASVLHEAMGYIRFLHDQVQVLSSPYLQSTQMKGEMQSSRYDLKSRGLCLVPVECTAHVASSNGADFWSPAAMGNSFGKH